MLSVSAPGKALAVGLVLAIAGWAAGTRAEVISDLRELVDVRKLRQVGGARAARRSEITSARVPAAQPAIASTSPTASTLPGAATGAPSAHLPTPRTRATTRASITTDQAPCALRPGHRPPATPDLPPAGR